MCAHAPDALRPPRFFLCARCQVQVLICSRCDRGHIYCSAHCSRQSRKERQRRSASRYQRTDRGALNHAARQQRYLDRRDKIELDHPKMTHQGSAPPTPPSTSHPQESAQSAQIHKTEEVDHDQRSRRPLAALHSHPDAPPRYRCSFCGCTVSAFFRSRFLRRSVRRTHRRARDSPRERG